MRKIIVEYKMALSEHGDKTGGVEGPGHRQQFSLKEKFVLLITEEKYHNLTIYRNVGVTR